MHGKLWRMDVNGGAPVTVSDAPEGRGISWGAGNMIAFVPAISGPVMEVPATGGTPRALTKTLPNTNADSDRWPVMLPDGKHFLYLHTPEGDASDRNEIRFAALDGTVDSLVSQGRYYTFHYADGWLLAVRDGSLQASKFDPSSGKLSGDPIQLLAKIAIDDITASAVFSVSQTGILLYQLGTSGTGDRHLWLDASGKQIAQVSEPGVYGPSRLSPDGTHIATPQVQPNDDLYLWVWDVGGKTRSRITSGHATGFYIPVWSPDGRTLYFDKPDDKGHMQLRQARLDGSQSEQVLLDSASPRNAADIVAADASPDGKWLLYEEFKKDTSATELKALPLVPGEQPFTLVDSVVFTSNARLKPGSGDWLLYQAMNSGRSEVYLTRFPHPGAKYQVTQNGGAQGVWSKDGKKIYYLDNLQRLTTVDIDIRSDDVEISAPQTLFPTGIRHSIPTGGFDITRDGKFLVVNSVTESNAPVVLVTNWQADLKR